VFRNASEGFSAECLQDIFRQVGLKTLAGTKRKKPEEEGINGSEWGKKEKKGKQKQRGEKTTIPSQVTAQVGRL
jgi:hypothetical protein